MSKKIKQVRLAAKRAAKPVSYCNINIKGADIGDFYSLYLNLNGKSKAIFAGTIAEENFIITIPGKKIKTICLKIKSSNGKTIRKDLSPADNINVFLKPASQIKESGGKKSFSSIREMLEERRRQLALQGDSG